MWEHALGIRLCHCFPEGVCHTCRYVWYCACSHITYISVHVMVHSVTLARTDILPEDGPTVTETCRRFYEILAF